MPKLTDSQLVILSAAARRQDGAVLPLPRSLKFKKAAATTVLKNLLKKGLVTERPAAADEGHWRGTKDGGRTALAITDTGLRAIGVDVDRKTSKQPGAKARPQKKRGRRAKHALTTSKPKGKTSPPAVRQGTKQALLIGLLKRKKGTTIEAIVEATGWQAHSVRAALTRLRQQGLQIDRDQEDRVSRYRVVAQRKAA
jgi:DNA-binding MarR family transcriptional regulator